MKKRTPLIKTLDVGLVSRGFRLGHQITQNLVNVLTEEELEHFEQHLDQIPKALRRGFSRPEAVLEQAKFSNISHENDILLWFSRTVEFYQKFLDLDVDSDLSRLIITHNLSVTRPKGFNWPIFIPSGLTARQAMDRLCKPQFRTYETLSLEDYTVITEERDRSKSRLILCRNTGTDYPDKEWLGKSADFMSATPTKFLDLAECIVLEALHFFITNQHLNTKGFTRIPRVRTADGEVASVGWDPDGQRFWVRCYDSDDSYPVAGGREAVVYT